MMSQEELNRILENHKRWLNGDDSGVRADLSSADLRSVDLRSVDLRSANLRFADLRSADLRSVDLRSADLSFANLSSTDLRHANLRHADLDFSSFPLWCGSLDIVTDKRLPVQLIYHFCRIMCDNEEIKAVQKQLKPLANQFHRVNECGVIK